MDGVTCPGCQRHHPPGTVRCPDTMKLLPREPARPGMALALPGRAPIALVPGVDVLLGRDPGSPIALGCADNVSRSHARVRAEPGRVVVEDLESANGTFLDDERLTPHRPVVAYEGMVIRLGSKPPTRLTVTAAAPPP